MMLAKTQLEAQSNKPPIRLYKARKILDAILPLLNRENRSQARIGGIEQDQR